MKYIFRNISFSFTLLTLSLHNLISNTVHTIPFIKSGGLILVDANLNGEEGHLIFDTGADGILVNMPSSINETDIVDYQSVSGTFKSYDFFIDILKLGTFELKELNAFTTDLSNVEALTGMNILGIIGASSFESEILRIDNLNGTLELMPREKSSDLNSGQLSWCPFKFTNNVPIIEVEIGKKVYSFGLDTGASTSIISKNVLDHHHDLISKSEERVNLATSSETLKELSRFHISSLKVNNVEFQSLSFLALDLGHLQEIFEMPVDGFLSIDQLPIKQMYIDFIEKKIFFKF